MKERTQKTIPLGFERKSADVVEEMEKTAETLCREGWYFLHSKTDPDLKAVVLTFERELPNP